MRALIVGSIVAAALAGCREHNAAPAVKFEPESKRLAPDSAENPAVLVESSGKMYALLIEGRNLTLHRSDDGGDSFPARVAITRTPEHIDQQAEASPVLLGHHASTYYVLWLARLKDKSELRLSRSVDYGGSFSEPTTVSLPGHEEISYFNATVAPNGELIVVWFSYEGGGQVPGTASLNVASSSDGGKTFTKPVRAAVDVCPCCRPAIIADREGRWYLAWRGVGKDHVRDVSVTLSSDRGATWSAPSSVSEDGWKIHGCPHSAPALAVFGGKLWVAWSTGTDGDYKGYFASSPLEKLAFSKREELTSGARDVNHGRLIVANERLFALFQGRDTKEKDGWGKSKAYLREIAPKVKAAVAAPRGEGSVSYPTGTAFPPGSALLAWTDLTETGASVRIARARLR